nr:MAG TPA: hypothetical protein [Caudoviricetes sp.]
MRSPNSTSQFRYVNNNGNVNGNNATNGNSVRPIYREASVTEPVRGVYADICGW